MVSSLLHAESDPSCVDSYDNDNYTSATCPKFKPEMDDIFLKELDLGCICRVAEASVHSFYWPYS